MRAVTIVIKLLEVGDILPVRNIQVKMYRMALKILELPLLCGECRRLFVFVAIIFYSICLYSIFYSVFAK